MVSEKIILLLQIGASIFMATDYFFAEKQRAVINLALKSYLQPLRDRLEQDLKNKVSDILSSWLSFLLPFLICFLCYVIAFWIFPVTAKYLNFWFALAVTAATCLALISNITRSYELLLKVVAPIAFATSIILITRFLINCPKGTVFGIGFVLLAISFICRSSNIAW